MFYNKRQICYTSVSDFTDFQGIGRDPLYIRYDSVWSVVQKYVDSAYQHFLAQPSYDPEEDHINWHIEETTERPRQLHELSDQERARYEAIKAQTIQAFRQSVAEMDGDELQLMAGVLRYLYDDFIFCADGKVYIVAWGMTPDSHKHQELGQCIRGYQAEEKITLTFDPGIYGTLAVSLESSLEIKANTTLEAAMWPKVNPQEGWNFMGWSPDMVGQPLTADQQFSALYEAIPQEPEPVVEEAPMFEPDPEPFEPTLTFVTNDCGTFEGEAQVMAHDGVCPSAAIPFITPRKGWTFQGWSATPDGPVVDVLAQHHHSDTTYYARYAKKEPWWHRWRSCLTALLAFLGLLLALAILFFFLHTCMGCRTPFGGAVDNGDNGDNIAPIDTVDGRDDNGTFKPITGEDGQLPDDTTIVAPITGEDGSAPPVLERPGMPDVVANRLLLFLEDENGDLDALARDFKAAYPGEQYSIIGADRNVKLLAIQIPEAERENIRKTINQKLSQHKFLVMDETLLQQPSVHAPALAPSRLKAPKAAAQCSELSPKSSEISQNNSEICSKTSHNFRQSAAIELRNTQWQGQNVELQQADRQQPGWHLNTIHLKQGWSYTQGAPEVTVAVMDDGIQANHPMFRGRIVNAYNVFRQDNRLSVGEGHGTHVAGLAAGAADNYAKGAAGVAPQCKIMPIQVADNKFITTSTTVAGIMYAVHHGADVVNISIGPDLSKIAALPPAEQMEVAKRLFRNEAYFWNRVCQIAAKKRCILVFAAGNNAVLSAVAPENRNMSSLVVTAVNRSLSQTSFTNYGIGSDISAPGENIVSAFPMSTFKPMDGTSMAAPIVTGAVALMKSLRRDITVEQARYVLQSTGQQVRGNVPPMLLLDRALAMVKSGNINPPAGSPGSATGGGDVAVDDGGNGGVGSGAGTGVGFVIGGGDDSYAGGIGSGGDVAGRAPGKGGSTPGSGDNRSSGGDYADNNGGISSGKNPPPSSGGDDDAAEIRRLIAEYKRKIADLESQLKQKRKK